MGKKKGHHFLPRFYLRQFGYQSGNNPPVWVHEKEKEPLSLPVSEIAKSKHLYSTRKEVDGEHDVGNEDALSKVENYMAPVYRKILQEESLAGLSEEERQVFASFVILMANRTPRMFEISDKDYKKLQMQVYKEGMAKTTDDELRMIYEKTKAAHPEMDVPFEEAKEFMRKGFTEEEIRLTHSSGIYGMWASIVDMLPYLLNMDWELWRPDDNQRFLTSDDPVVGLVHDGRGYMPIKPGWGHPSLEITFPLSPTLCFSANKKGETGDVKLSSEGVPFMNELRITMSERFVFSSRREDLEELFEERDKSQAPEPWKLGKLY